MSIFCSNLADLVAILFRAENHQKKKGRFLKSGCTSYKFRSFPDQIARINWWVLATPKISSREHIFVISAQRSAMQAAASERKKERTSNRKELSGPLIKLLIFNYATDRCVINQLRWRSSLWSTVQLCFVILLFAMNAQRLSPKWMCRTLTDWLTDWLGEI